MMTKTSSVKRHCQIGPRDIEILTALDRCPLTAQQLLRLSQTFSVPFGDAGNLRRRLRHLAHAGYVRCWPYAVANDGRSPRYFRLDRDGYRLLYGTNTPLPKRRRFEAIAPARHHHTFSLSELIVHLLVTAQRHGAAIEDFAPENSVRLQADPFTLWPDCAFVVRRRDGRRFPFVVELDNSTERVRSRLETESIERKLRGYDAHQARFGKFDPERYLVLFVTTRSERRLDNILNLAGTVMRQQQRTVFVGSSLQAFLAGDPFTEAMLRDHRQLRRTLVPALPAAKSRQSVQQQPVTVLP